MTGGASNLILDCVVARGNPADTDLAIPMLDRQKQKYRRYPLKVCFDGGFASKTNLKLAKKRKIKDVCSAKKARPGKDRYVPQRVCVSSAALLSYRY